MSNKMDRKEKLNLMMADYALDYVPMKQRSTFYSLLTVMAGAFVSGPSFTTGALIASGLNLSDTILAVFIGGMVIQLGIMILTGNIGVKTGLPTAYLSRWLGFGHYGSILPSVLIAIAAFGWLAFNNALLGHAIYVGTNGFISEPLANILVGIAAVLFANFGYKGLAVLSNWAVPLFSLMLVYGLYNVLGDVGGFGAALAIEPVGTMSISNAIMLATGLFVSGAVLNADVGRYAKSSKDMNLSATIAAFLGLFLTVVTAAVMALVTGTNDPVALIIEYTGMMGVLFFALITLTTVDYDLYLVVLYVTNIYGLFRDKEEAMKKKPIINAVIGIAGGLVAAYGILDLIGGFIFGLAIFIPAVAGIFVCHYFVLTKGKINFKEMPAPVNWVGIISYLVGTLANYLSAQADFGIPALNAIIVSFVLYWVLSLALKSNINTIKVEE